MAAADILNGFIEAGHAVMTDNGGVRLASGIDSNQIAAEKQSRANEDRRRTLSQDPRLSVPGEIQVQQPNPDQPRLEDQETLN